MLDSASLPVFVIASLVLLVTPGPAVLFVVARSIDHGRWAGVVSSVGLGLGNLVHVVVVTAGLSAILVSSPMTYSTLKYAGAAYLIYLGVRKLVDRTESAQVEAIQNVELGVLFYQGIVVNVLNPKVALFFLAFLPQFVDPSRAHPVLQLAVLGLLFVVLGIATDIIYAFLAGTVGTWLRSL